MEALSKVSSVGRDSTGKRALSLQGGADETYKANPITKLGSMPRTGSYKPRDSMESRCPDQCLEVIDQIVLAKTLYMSPSHES
jgi:hypothetical protein